MRLGSWTGLAALGMAALMASSAFAQPGGAGGRGGRGAGGGMGGRQTAVTLAGNEAVQKELALTDDQIAKVKTLGEEARAELRPSGDGFAGLRDLPESERRAKMTELMAKQAEASKAAAEKYKPKLAAVLDAKQIERLDQIAVQAAGSQAYADPAVVKALKLTQDQQDKIASINKEAGEKTRELFGAAGGGGGGAGAGNGEKIRELNQTRDKDVAAVLTADQTAAFAKLKGKEFDVAQLRRGPGGGGQGGNRPAGGRQRPAQ
ncbi:MAG: hypothetical protein JWP89_1676 [Schlesneria sp.]|nr:hypothetical protein [Schlesneria sp.]